MFGWNYFNKHMLL